MAPRNWNDFVPTNIAKKAIEMKWKVSPRVAYEVSSIRPIVSRMWGISAAAHKSMKIESWNWRLRGFLDLYASLAKTIAAIVTPRDVNSSAAKMIGSSAI